MTPLHPSSAPVSRSPSVASLHSASTVSAPPSPRLKPSATAPQLHTIAHYTNKATAKLLFPDMVGTDGIVRKLQERPSSAMRIKSTPHGARRADMYRVAPPAARRPATACNPWMELAHPGKLGVGARGATFRSKSLTPLECAQTPFGIPRHEATPWVPTHELKLNKNRARRGNVLGPSNGNSSSSSNKVVRQMSKAPIKLLDEPPASPLAKWRGRGAVLPPWMVASRAA